MDGVFSKLHYELLAESSRHHAHKLVALLHVSADPRQSKGHTCPMSIVFMDISAAMHIGQQLLRLPPLKERAKPMQRLRLLNTLSVACTLLCASHLLVVQNGYACSWHAELFDYTTQETTHFSVDETPVKIPIVQAEKGVDVHCSLDPSEVISIGILKQQKVDIVCRYPDDQMITARAITIFDLFTGETLTHPVILFFSNTRKYNETLYRLYVACQ